MNPLEDQLSPEKQEVFAAYRRKEITLAEAARQIEDLDNPHPRAGWLVVALVVAFLVGGAYAAVRG